MKPSVGESFNHQANQYAAFADNSFSWKYIEQPAFDDHLMNLYRAGTRVLDLGCGSGRVVHHLITRGVPASNITGIDTSREMLEKARRTAPKATFIETNVQRLPFADGSFSLVTSNMMLHMLDHDEAKKVLGEVSRVLLPGGVFFFVDTNPEQDPEDLHINEWVTKRSPWGTDLSIFQHDLNRLLKQEAPVFGLTLTQLSFPDIAPGAEIEADEYARYSAKPFRVCATLTKSGNL